MAPDYSNLDPSNLKPSLLDGTGENLKPSLVTDAYAGGTPTSADEIKPAMTDADGELKPAWNKPANRKPE